MTSQQHLSDYGDLNIAMVKSLACVAQLFWDQRPGLNTVISEICYQQPKSHESSETTEIIKITESCKFTIMHPNNQFLP